MNLVGICGSIDERPKLDARLAIRSEAHYLPFVTVRNEAEKISEGGIEETERIRKVDGTNGIEASIAAVPYGSGFPSPASINYDDSSIVKTGIGIRAERMGKMMVDKTEAGTCLAEVLGEPLHATALMAHAQKMHCRGKQIEARKGHFAGSEALQVVTETRTRCLPAEANFVDVIGGDAGELKARANGVVWEVAVMFDAAYALFSDGEEELSIADDARGGIMRPCVVDSQSDHQNSSSRYKQNTDASPALFGIFYNFTIVESLLDFVPEAVHFTRLFLAVCGDVVEGNHAAAADVWRVHFEIALHTPVGVITVDEKIVELVASEEALDAGLGFRCMRITAYEVQLLLVTREPAIQRHFAARISATEPAGGQIDADNTRSRGRKGTEKKQCSAVVRPDFEAALGSSCLD